MILLFFIKFFKLLIYFINGDWGLGIGDWGLGPIPNHQSPKPKSKNQKHQPQNFLIKKKI